MPRTLDPITYAVKRDAFLDVAERLMRTEGWDRVSIQDILRETEASKGAFYHYFDSKEALLEAVVERMADGALALVEPIAADPDLTAPAKLQAVFSLAGQWKSERSDLLLGMLRSWYDGRNDIVRQRVARAGATRITPILERIIAQGTVEGTLTPTWPAHTATILMGLFTGSGDVIGRLVLDRRDGLVPFEEAERFIAAYEEAIERILGLPDGAFTLIDAPAIHVWFD
jgi:AcrR family transcriptional regulator